MKSITRRSFLASTTALAGAAALSPKSIALLAPQNRHHPLDGIEPENLKITDVTVTPLSYVDPTRNLWRLDKYIVWKTDAALCQIFTDQGIVGIAEGTPYRGPDNIKKYTEEVFKPMIVGKNPFDVIRQRPAGLEMLPMAAWAGIDNALWDVIGKVKNKPVYELLSVDGNPKPRIRMYASGGVEHEWYNKGDDFLITEAVRYRAMGFDAFKFRVGTDWKHAGMTLQTYRPIMERLREAVGPDFRLMHETVRNTGLTMNQVLNEFCPMLDDLDFYWFEDPMELNYEHYQKCKERLKRVYVVGGGNSSGTPEFSKEGIKNGALEIVQSDSNVVGLTENWIISRLADAHNRFHCPHNWHGGLTTIANAHLVAAIPNRHLLEINMTFNPLKEAIFKDPLVVKNGWMDLPNKPGFGVEVIDDIEKRFPFEPGHFQRENPITVG